MAVVEAEPGQSWRSVRPGKIPWTQAEVERLAAAIHRNLPATLLTLFNDDYDGQGLLGLPTSKGIKTPTASEVSLNYVFLLPLVQAFPSKVPSAYLLTDVFLELDRRLDRKMLKPSSSHSRMDLAAVEACKCKKLLGSLRNLWRSSGLKGHNDRVTHLKSLLQPSPNRVNRPSGEVQEDAPDPVQDESEDGGIAEDDGSENGGAEDASEIGSGSEDASEQECEGSEVEKGDSEVKDPSPSPKGNGRGDSDADVPPASQVSSADSLLNAPTLRLDDCHEVSSEDSEDSAESDPPDSQVPGAGWMGRAMMSARHLEREEKEIQKKRDRIQCLLGDIRFNLSAQCKGDEEDADFNCVWDDYSKFCSDALMAYDEDEVFETLACKVFFMKWLREQKAAPAQEPGSATAMIKEPKKAGSRDGFGKALELMNLGSAEHDEDSVVTPAAKRPKHATTVAEAVNATPPPVVGPQTVKRMAAKKVAVKTAQDDGELGDPVSKFGEYDLDELNVPYEARPREGQTHLGHHGYTIYSKTGAAVECLLRSRAFVVKRTVGPECRKGQVTWSKFGTVREAWVEACARSGF